MGDALMRPEKRMMRTWKTQGYADFTAPSIGIYLGQWDDSGERPRFSVATDLVMLTLAEGEATPDTPLVKLSQTEAQVLMDSLWDCGLRPSEGSGSAGAMLATQQHLADSQKAVGWLQGSVERLLAVLTVPAKEER